MKLIKRKAKIFDSIIFLFFKMIENAYFFSSYKNIFSKDKENYECRN